MHRMDLSVQRKSLFPDDPNPACGYGPFRTGADDPFLRSCVVHDLRYGQHDTGEELEPYTRSRADREFLDNMLRQSGDSLALKVRAYVYYGLVRSLGWLVW